MDGDLVVADQVVEHRGLQLTVRWRPRPFQPPHEAITQATGVCFTPDGMIVLVNADSNEPPYWTLPGGQPEGEETPREAFIREVAEEACARVTDCGYIGCQEVIGERPSPHFQTRFWALVELELWEPQFEMTDRLLVHPTEFVSKLAWGDAPVAPELLRLAQAHRQKSDGVRQG